MHKIKMKIISEYNKYVHAKNVGKDYDYTHILDMISLLEIASYTNNPDMILNHFIDE